MSAGQIWERSHLRPCESRRLSQKLCTWTTIWPPGRRIRHASASSLPRASRPRIMPNVLNIERAIQNSIRKAAQPTQIRLHRRQQDSALDRFQTDHFQHRPGKVNSGDHKTATCKAKRVPARSAAEIHQPPRLDEPLVDRTLVGLKKRMISEIGIFFRGQPRGVRVFQSGASTPGGRRHAGGTRVIFMSYQ